MNEVREQTRLLLDAHQVEMDIENRRDIENEIIILNEGLCADVVWKYRNIPLEVEDAMQVARIAMLKAIQTFDGIHQFSTHAVTIMVRDLLNVRTAARRSKRVGNVLSLDKPSEDGLLYSEILPGSVDIENETYERMLSREILAAAPNLLSEKEYQVFLYAVGCTYHEDRKAVAAALKITTTYVTMLKNSSFAKVRKQFTYAG